MQQFVWRQWSSDCWIWHISLSISWASRWWTQDSSWQNYSCRLHIHTEKVVFFLHYSTCKVLKILPFTFLYFLKLFIESLKSFRDFLLVSTLGDFDFWLWFLIINQFSKVKSDSLYQNITNDFIEMKISCFNMFLIQFCPYFGRMSPAANMSLLTSYLRSW